MLTRTLYALVPLWLTALCPGILVKRVNLSWLAQTCKYTLAIHSRYAVRDFVCPGTFRKAVWYPGILVRYAKLNCLAEHVSTLLCYTQAILSGILCALVLLWLAVWYPGILLCPLSYFVFFQCGVLNQMWYLIVSIPDLCRLSYFNWIL